MLNEEMLSDRLAKASVQSRQIKENERKERIFNDKVRTIGVDKAALDMQIEEKKRQEKAVKEEQISHDSAMLNNSRLAYQLHNRQVDERRAVAKATVNYWHQYQQPRKQQENDLNKQHAGKTEHGAGQMLLPGLVGEDREIENRRQRQKEQVRAWLMQQQSEKALERQRQKLEEQHIDQRRAEMDLKALQLQCLDAESRRSAVVSTKEYNLAKAKEKKLSQGENESNIDLLQEQVTSADTQFTHGMLGAPGLFASNDVKLPPESPQQVIQFWKFQIEEKKRTELQKRQDEELLDRVCLESAQAAQLIEKEQASLNKQLRHHMDSTNIQLAEIHRQEKPDIERGAFDDSFFSKFNTCSR